MDATNLDTLLSRQPVFVARPSALDADWLAVRGLQPGTEPRPGGEVTVVIVANAEAHVEALADLPDVVRAVIVDRSGVGLSVPDGVGSIAVDPGECLAAARNAGAALARTPSITFAGDHAADPGLVARLASQRVGAAVTVAPAEGAARVPSGWQATAWDRSLFCAAGGFDADRCGFEGLVLAHRLVEVHGVDVDQFTVAEAGEAPAASAPHCQSARCTAPAEERAWWIERDFPLLAHTHAALDAEVAATRVLAGADAVRRSIIKELAARRREGWRSVAPSEREVDPEVAVVVTSYNMSDELARAVRSVMGQTLDAVELVVVDDASPNPVAVDRAKSFEDVATVVLRDTNGGAAAARNTGVAVTSAPIVVCLDGDDELAAEYLADAVRVFELLPDAEVVAPHVRYTGDRTDKWRVRDGATVVNALAESPCGVSTAFRRSAWERVGGFDESMRGYEDWDFWIRVLDGSPAMRSIPRPHFRYRVSATSKVNTSNANADAIVGYLTTKHAALYREHFAQVFAIKHRQVLYARRRALSAAGVGAAQPEQSERVERAPQKRSRSPLIRAWRKRSAR